MAYFVKMDFNPFDVNQKNQPITRLVFIFFRNYKVYSISEILNVFTIPLLAIGIEARLITISPF